MPEENNTINALKLEIESNNVNWTLRPMTHASGQADWEGPVKDKGNHKIVLPDWQRDAVDLLIELLQLLTKVSRAQHISDIKKDREAMERLAPRVANVIGQHLFELLFKEGPDLARVLRQEIENTKLGLLRVELEFKKTHANLARWPWEYLCPPVDDGVEARPLAHVSHLVLNRHLDPSDRRMRTPTPVRVLLVMSQPDKLSSVQCDQVLETIKKLQDNHLITLETIIDRFEPTPDYRPTITKEKFSERLRCFKPNIVHFIGHGELTPDGGTIAFIKPGGAADPVRADEFAEMLSHQADLKLVFLQACESALANRYARISGIAEALAVYKIPAVVAMQFKVENQIANNFAARFYSELAKGKPVDLAVKAGREAVRSMDGVPEYYGVSGLPVLFLRSYESLIVLDGEGSGRGNGPKLDNGGKGKKQRICPRCRSKAARKNRFCMQCGLTFICLAIDGNKNPPASCNRWFDDPLLSFCPECGQPIVQKPWAEAPVTLQPADTLELMSGPSAAAAASAPLGIS
jgi:hypothetical protein